MSSMGNSREETGEEEEVLFVEENCENASQCKDTGSKGIPQEPDLQSYESTASPGHESAIEPVQANEEALQKEATDDLEIKKRQRLDPVQLASILKDFDGASDPLFAGCPGYVAAIVKELLEGDFLLVLGRGLGLNQVLNLFLAKVRQTSPNALVLVLGRRHEEEHIDSSSRSHQGTNLANSTKTFESNEQRNEEFNDNDTISFGISAAKRIKLYSQGGVYHITAPIAVVDILTGALDCTTVSGLIIAHGETVAENSTAAFAIKLLKANNPNLFIKALSDSPERLVMPPALSLRLRVLGVPTIMLWPRFHLAVDRSLPQLEVDEIIVEQAPAVRKQQALLTELTQAVLSDVKRRIPHLDVEFLAPTLGSQQLQEDPEKLHGTTTAEAILSAADLPWRIRNALQGVWHKLSADGKRSVYSLGTLQQLQRTLTQFDAMSFWSQLDFAYRSASEPWVALPEADMLLAEAKREAVLQRVPGKFSHLRDLLSSIPANKRVLILCTSPRTVFELSTYLSQTIQEQTENEEVTRALEESIRLEEERKARVRAQERAAKINEGRPGRRRVRGGKASSPGRSTQAGSAEPASNNEVKPEISDEPTVLETKAVADSNNSSSPSANDMSQHQPLKRKYEEIDLTGGVDDGPDSESISLNIPLFSADITLGTYRSADSLHVLKPDHVVMYDPDLQFTREVERYAASTPKEKPKVNVHFMYYQRSVEELQYLTEMRREKDAFTKLIREKGIMPMVFRDGEPNGGANDDVRVIRGSKRGYEATRVRQRIVVDTREFRSALPFLIWQSQVDVVPVTLLVGDYILTPEIVVERKSISDLVGSFRDGRLYAQCESMHKHYKIAVLLIEFDNLSNFSMEPFKDVRSKQSSDIQREIQENISALLLRFPKLKLIWSASPLHSAQIFKGMKEMEPDPEPEDCAKAGQSVLFDSVALSMLESLPGITPGNAHLLARRASTLEEICRLSRQDILDALGPENGDKLYRFLSFRRPDSIDLSMNEPI